MSSGDRLTEIVDRHGFVHARLAWAQPDDGTPQLVELQVAGAIVRGALVDDPLLGRAHEIVAQDARILTTMSAIDWAHPTQIPAIASPGALPPGSGGAIMNVLAILAQRAGVTELRYAGPYPTNALYATLGRSFRTTTTEEEFTSAFVERAGRVARDPMPAVFVPAPHERIAIDRDGEVRGIVELRDGIERVAIDGVVYAKGVTRLVGTDDVRAEVWFAGQRYAHVATLRADGELVEGPHPIPPCDSDVVGKAFPPEMVAALAELIAEVVPAPLAAAATHVVAAHRLRWADLGARAATRVGVELHLHAALWRLAPQGMARVAMALVDALVPVVTPLAARNLLAHGT